MSLTIKICGLSTPETLDAALAAGADMVGFVFFEKSPRRISLEAARLLGGRTGTKALKVALTVDADDANVAAIEGGVDFDAHLTVIVRPDSPGKSLKIALANFAASALAWPSGDAASAAVRA